MSATVRSIPPGSAAETIAAIDRLLEEVASDEQVVIPIAIESGSRAWGFPSPDSDYDCRFIFVRRQADYLTPWPRRDVIETPLVGDLDVNGWDLGKALKLIVKGNAVVLEWLRSPFVYAADPVFRDGLLALATRLAEPGAIARHYLHLGESQRRTYFPDGQDVALKKLFYALRPAAALRWLGMHGGPVPPMHFPTLMSECDPPADVAALTAELLAAKARTRELGVAPLPSPLGAFIDAEFAAARVRWPATPRARGAVAEAEAFFRDQVVRLDQRRLSVPSPPPAAPPPPSAVPRAS
ncbi:nucleotidyltransferase domain-containing protein [Sphingomonas bacterium]|uniref:nucleotidyltransferase domain-containing protein n=1 Tax=Sphingomonas bacterium TaxID=1895847 RepID=UPI001C2D1D8A|nr:nucleotidyltransferase domain-containing protein [Sphingomonas bacterium]